MNDATRCKKWISMMIGGAMALTVSGALLARDAGLNQRGAAGNAKGAGPARIPASISPAQPATGAQGHARTAASISPVRRGTLGARVPARMPASTNRAQPETGAASDGSRCHVSLIRGVLTL